MCRWLGYSGSSVLMEDIILRPEPSLIDQSRASKEGAETTNGDGFGVGWYTDLPDAGVFKSIEPAWNDRNLQNLCRHIRSHLFVAHVRATTGTPVQQTNCHPFTHGKWLLVHNGAIRAHARVRRDLALAVAPELFPGIEGSTDSELMFNLALTFGLKEEPLAALERMTGFVEDIGRRHEVEHPIQMTLGVSDGTRLYAVRYSSEHLSRSLYHSISMQEFYELNPLLRDRLGPETRAVVSEPIGAFSAGWQKVPESSALIVERGEVEVVPFTPRAP